MFLEATQQRFTPRQGRAPEAVDTAKRTGPQTERNTDYATGGSSLGQDPRAVCPRRKTSGPYGLTPAGSKSAALPSGCEAACKDAGLSPDRWPPRRPPKTESCTMNTAQRMTGFSAPVAIDSDRGRSSGDVPMLLRRQFDVNMAMVMVANEDPGSCDEPSNGGCFYCSGPETD